MSRHLIIGASGQVGEHLVNAAKKAGHEVIGTYNSHPINGLRHLDIRDALSTQSLITEVQPDIVFLPASLTNVDFCEKYQEESYQINVLGVSNVISAIKSTKTKLVYFSSDYIFDGEAGPYGENDLPNPICVYGHQKVIAEHQIALNINDFLIIRTTVVYGWESQGKNFIFRLIRTLKNEKEINVPIDQIGSPTYAPNLAESVMELVNFNEKGVFHVVGPERVSRYDFACEASIVFNLNKNLINPVKTLEVYQAAKRPLNAGMSTDKATSILSNPLIGYKKGLRVMEGNMKAQ